MVTETDQMEGLADPVEHAEAIGSSSGPAFPPLIVTALVVTKVDLVAALQIYVESPTAGTGSNYAIYQNGAASNYFGGNVGIGSSSRASGSASLAGTAR